MGAALRKPDVEYGFDLEQGLQGTTLLSHVRHVARRSRCKKYVDLFGACAVLSGNRHVAAQAASEVLMRGLSQALGRRPVIYRVDESDMSFDEAWLLALARSLKTDDTDSATFLLNSRVKKHLHRNLVFLLRAVIDKFPQV